MSLLDNLPKNLPFFSKPSQSEYYFALNISFSKVTAAIWGIVGNKVELISTAQAPYDASPENMEDSLIEASNLSLDQALADFQPEPTKLLFGVPEAWLQDENIKPEYLQSLKRMVKELDVTPLAYVSSVHAICHLLQKQQGVPITAVIVQVANPLVVTVVKAGKIIVSKAQKRTNNLPEDVEKILLNFSEIEVLPSKFLVYAQEEEDTDKFKDELSAYPWMNKLPFLHLPKIELLDPALETEAVCFAGASELNPSVSSNIINQSLNNSNSEVGKLNKRVVMDDDNLSLPSTGFVAGDINKRAKPMVEDEELSYPEDEALEEETLPVPSRRGSALVAYPASPLLTQVKTALAPVTTFFQSKFGSVSGGKNKFIILPIVVLVILIGLYLFLEKAKVTIFIDMRVLENESQVIADPTITSVDQAANKIPGKIISTDISGTAKGQATGKKQIGDPAKGTVVVYNKTSGPKSFSQGTVLVGPNNMEMTLDTSVEIASQSAVDGGIAFGKSTVNATASKIGPDGNLAAGQDLTIKGQDSNNYSAKVDQAFSGGVSKDVNVVTADDQNKLLAQLSSDLKKQAQDQLQGKLTGDLKILEQSFAETISKKTFSKAIGDQASDFTLNLTGTYKGTAYSDSDLKSVVSKLVQTNVPEGYTLDLTQTQTQADVSKVEKNGQLVFNAKFSAKLMPKIDLEQLKKDIAFKSVAQAQERVRKIENVLSAKIETTPSLPGPLNRLPLLTKNIDIQVTAK